MFVPVPLEAVDVSSKPETISASLPAYVMSTTGPPDEVMESGICWKTRSSVVSPAAVQSFVLTASPRRRRSSSVSLTAQRPRTAVSSDPRTAVRVSLKARAKKFPTRAAMPFQNRSLMRSQNPPPGGMHRCQSAGCKPCSSRSSCTLPGLFLVHVFSDSSRKCRSYCPQECWRGRRL